jgi:hypothetical protein
MKCNTIYERKYDKPELFESFVPVERIKRCPECKTGDYLGRPKHGNINVVVAELKDHNTFSEIDPLRIIVFGDDEPAFDNTIHIDRHIGEKVIVTGDIYNIDIELNEMGRMIYEDQEYMLDTMQEQEFTTNKFGQNFHVPGYSKKDIRLSIDEDILRIRANRDRDEELHTGSVYYKHRPRQIDKRIMLPISPPDSEKIVGAATYVDGVITVRIPTVQPKNIQIL